MYIDEITNVFLAEAKDQISGIEEMSGGKGLTYGQTDAIREVRDDLRRLHDR